MAKFGNIVRIFLCMTFLTGIIYPLFITFIAQMTMKSKADGSFISLNNQVIGSKFIGQKFEGAHYFWGRPSFTDYNALPSSGSNLSSTSIALKKLVEERKEKFFKDASDRIPKELLFASGSGLDPDIHISTAYFQVDRVTTSRGMDSEKIKNLINEMASWRGYVNVLALNMALDGIQNQ